MLILFSLIINSVFYYCIYYYSTITFASVICSHNKESSNIIKIYRLSHTGKTCGGQWSGCPLGNLLSTWAGSSSCLRHCTWCREAAVRWQCKHALRLARSGELEITDSGHAASRSMAPQRHAFSTKTIAVLHQVFEENLSHSAEV